MADLEKVLKGLRCCTEHDVGKCLKCPYGECLKCPHGVGLCHPRLAADALELLKEQPKQKFFVDSDGKMTPLPVQKHGHWVFDPDGMDWNIPAWKCSECHCRNDNIPPNLERTNPLRWSGSKFCPNCGARMDEEVSLDG